MAKPNNPIFIGLCYFTCALLVFCYVNFFFLYKFIQEQFGDSFIKWTPFLLPPLLLLLFLLQISCKNQIIKKDLNLNWILLGICFCVFALFLPDPKIAVKKIHVTEYFMLSLLVRYTMSHKYRSWKLLFFSALFTAILGVHDEFLQGLHPSRTYGLRDMAVNICSAIGGGFIWHGLKIFNHHKKPPPLQQTKISFLPVFYYLGWLILSIAALAVPVSSYLNANIPLWATLPLGSSFVIFSLYYPTFQKSQYAHGVSALSFASVPFLLYPLSSHVLQTSFY